MTRRNILSLLLCAALMLTLLAGCNPADQIIEDDDYSSDPVITGDPVVEDDDYGDDPVVTDDPSFQYNDPLEGWVFPEYDGIIDDSADMRSTGALNIYVPPSYDAWLMPAVEEFQMNNPHITVEVTRFIQADSDKPDWERYNRIYEELLAGKGPDLLFPHTLSDLNQQMAMNRGLFLNLTDVLAADINREDYVEGVLDGGIYKGRQYVVPFGYRVPAYLARADTLRAIGFNALMAENPVSFLEEVARVLPLVVAHNSAFESMLSFDDEFEFPYGAESAEFNHFFQTAGLELIDWENQVLLPDKNGLRQLCEAYKPLYVTGFRRTEPFYVNAGTADGILEGRDVFQYYKHTLNLLLNAAAVKMKSEYECEVQVLREL